MVLLESLLRRMAARSMRGPVTHIVTRPRLRFHTQTLGSLRKATRMQDPGNDIKEVVRMLLSGDPGSPKHYAALL